MRSIAEYRLNNGLHSGLLLLSMGLLMSVLGWVLLGPAGVAASLLLAIVFLNLGRRVPPSLVMRMRKAWPIQPAAAPDLHRMVERLSRRGGLGQTPRLYLIARNEPNSFAAGDAVSGSAIAVTEGLLRRLSPRELNAVLAHEIAHIARGDTGLAALADLLQRWTTSMTYLGQLLLFFLLPALLAGGSNLPLSVLLLLFLAPLGSALLQLALSRTREYGADLTAAEWTGDPIALASALRKMESTYDGWLKHLLSRRHQGDLLNTHPRTEKRIRRLLALAAEIEPQRLAA